MSEEAIPIVMFIVLGLTFMVWFYLKFRAKVETQQTIRLALEKGTELSPEFIRQIGDPEPPKDRDLRRGMVFLAIALGFSVLGAAIPDDDAMQIMIGVAAFPFFIGLAFLVMWRYGARQ